MDNKNYLEPNEIASLTIKKGISKVNRPLLNQFISSILAGAFIAFAAEGSNMAAFNLWSQAETYGLGKTLAGTIFGVGLMLVLLAGGDLFTGNILIFIAFLEKKVRLKDMLKNWVIVFAGNFIGASLIAFMIVQSGQLHASQNLLGGITIKIAVGKVSYPFISAFFLGIMCNWLVCLAVWLSYGAKDYTGKILAIFFPIWLFITSGFEHSIANMYYIPAGIMAKANEHYVEASHISEKVLHGLNVKSFVINNLVPVTIGNIVGGVVFVGGVYWFLYLKKKNKEVLSKKTAA